MVTFYINATNVHQGGGAVLLSELIANLSLDDQIVLRVDRRFQLPLRLPTNLRVIKVNPSIIGRLLSDYALSRDVLTCDRVLCFGNVPPVFKIKGKVSVFVQNRYLVDSNRYLSWLPLGARLRILFERILLKFCRKNVDQFFVQTSSMQSCLANFLSISEIDIQIAPVTIRANDTKPPMPMKKFDYVYVASGEAHKNHMTLLRAISILSEEGLYPSLALTLDRNAAPEICNFIDEMLRGDDRLSISNLGSLSHDEVLCLYRNSTALLYPSLFESFGLPLIEADELGLSIVASELDYVRDVVTPTETFDPQSAISIARAVKRHMGVDCGRFGRVCAGEFVRLCL